MRYVIVHCMLLWVLWVLWVLLSEGEAAFIVTHFWGCRPRKKLSRPKQNTSRL